MMPQYQQILFFQFFITPSWKLLRQFCYAVGDSGTMVSCPRTTSTLPTLLEQCMTVYKPLCTDLEKITHC